MHLGADQVRRWIESWSWHIPRGPQHGGMAGDLREWWSLRVRGRNDHADLRLDVNRLRASRGSALLTYARVVPHEALCPLPDYRSLVRTLNLAVADLFSEAEIRPPRLPGGSGDAEPCPYEFP